MDFQGTQVVSHGAEGPDPRLQQIVDLFCDILGLEKNSGLIDLKAPEFDEKAGFKKQLFRINLAAGEIPPPAPSPHKTMMPQAGHTMIRPGRHRSGGGDESVLFSEEAMGAALPDLTERDKPPPELKDLRIRADVFARACNALLTDDKLCPECRPVALNETHRGKDDMVTGDRVVWIAAYQMDAVLERLTAIAANQELRARLQSAMIFGSALQREIAREDEKLKVAIDLPKPDKLIGNVSSPSIRVYFDKSKEGHMAIEHHRYGLEQVQEIIQEAEVTTLIEDNKGRTSFAFNQPANLPGFLGNLRRELARRTEGRARNFEKERPKPGTSVSKTDILPHDPDKGPDQGKKR